MSVEPMSVEPMIQLVNALAVAIAVFVVAYGIADVFGRTER